MTAPRSLAIQRLQDGGLVELSRLFEENRDRLRQMIGKCIRGKLGARFDASDIIQESFIRAQRQLETYLSSPTIQPEVWLRVLARQLLAESIRKHMRAKRSPEFETVVADDLLFTERLADTLNSVGDEVSRDESIQELQQGLQLLSEAERTLVTLRHGEGMKFPEIADVLNIKMETAKKRYYRALQRLKKHFKDED